MASAEHPDVIDFRCDMTLRWSCRSGDFLIWTRVKNIFADQPAVRILDIWEMRDGDFVTITNRPTDLPSWFELHPTEVCDSLVYQMAAKVESGYPFKDPIDGPNIWRLRAGDRLAWVGANRPDRKGVNGVLAILDCSECALAIGDSSQGGLEELARFGALSKDAPTPQESASSRFAIDAIRKMGVPHEIATEWLLG